jgi:hypothetical protein
MTDVETITDFFSYNQDSTKDYGIVDYRGTMYGFVQLEDSNGQIHSISEYLTNNNMWFIHKLTEESNDGTYQKMAFIDNWGNLWSSQIRHFQSAACSPPSILHKIKSGNGIPLTDKCIEKLKSDEWIISTGLGGRNTIEGVYTVFTTYVSLFRQIKDIVEKLTTHNHVLEDENTELKQNVTDLSNENDKLTNLIFKNRWMIVF